MDAEDRFLAYATAQAALVGGLAGLAGALALFTPLGFSHTYLAQAASGPAAVLTHWLLGALVVVGPVLYVLVPLGVAGYVAATGRGTLGTTVAVGSLLFVFVVATVAGGFLAGPASALVEQRNAGAPQASFAYEYTERGDGRGILTVTHDGGDAVRADRLVVQGHGITAVRDADQTEAGPWRGETSEAATIDGEQGIAPGDAVRVGVGEDCVVRIVYETRWDSATLGKYTCPGA